MLGGGGGGVAGIVWSGVCGAGLATSDRITFSIRDAKLHGEVGSRVWDVTLWTGMELERGGGNFQLSAQGLARLCERGQARGSDLGVDRWL